MILTRPIVVISIAPIVKVIRREFINEIPLSLKNFATNPLARHPKSAMRNGSHTNMAISFRLKCSVSTKKCSVSTKKTGTQKLIVPHAGSAKKAGNTDSPKVSLFQDVDYRCFFTFWHCSDAFPDHFQYMNVLLGRGVLHLWIFIENQPDKCGYYSQYTSHNKSKLPAVEHNAPCNQRQG